MKSGILIGTHYHSGDEATLRRQTHASAAIRSLRGVRRVNLQFEKGPLMEREGFTTVRRLQNDSCKASRLIGRRTPVLSELCNILGEIATVEDLPYFMLVNSDELVLEAVVDVVLDQRLDGYIFSRMDFSHETGEEIGMLFGGQGCWVIQTEWWRRNAWRIRPYIMGEAYTDTIMTTKMLCHGQSRLFNRSGEYVRHEAHPRLWPLSPFLDYTRYLASLDSLYLFIWHEYIADLEKLRDADASEAEEVALQERVFEYQPTVTARFGQGGRSLKAWMRYRAQVFVKMARSSLPGSSLPGSRA